LRARNTSDLMRRVQIPATGLRLNPQHAELSLACLPPRRAGRDPCPPMATNSHQDAATQPREDSCLRQLLCCLARLHPPHDLGPRTWLAFLIGGLTWRLRVGYYSLHGGRVRRRRRTRRISLVEAVVVRGRTSMLSACDTLARPAVRVVYMNGDLAC
jgi:hypothetical protein